MIDCRQSRKFLYRHILSEGKHPGREPPDILERRIIAVRALRPRDRDRSWWEQPKHFNIRDLGTGS